MGDNLFHFTVNGLYISRIGDVLRISRNGTRIHQQDIPSF